MSPNLDVFLHAVGATGVSRNAVAICGRMAARGWRVRLLCCRVAHGFEPPGGVAVMQLPGGEAANRSYGLARALLPLRRALSAGRPTVFLSAGNHAHATALLASERLDLCRLFRVSNDVERGSTILGDVTARILRRGRSRLVLVSQALASSRAFEAAVGSGRATVIPNGVDLGDVAHKAAAPMPHAILGDGGGPVIIALARANPQKNLGALVTALGAVRQRVPARLVILGGGSAQARAALTAQTRALGLEEAVLMPGVTPNPFAWLARSDVFALPSLWEGSSNALLEALACGVPVVASRTAGDAAHVLGGGAHGVLIDPGDPRDLAAGLLRQLGPDPIPPGGRAAAFSLERTLDAYERLLTALAARPL